MRPLDPAVIPHLRPARRLLLVVLAAGGVQAALVVTQAFLLAGGIVAMVDQLPIASWAIAFVLVSAARAATSYVGDDCAGRAAAKVGATLRHRLLSRVIRCGPDEAPSTGSLTLLATRGVQETEPYLTRYLPALVLAALLPPVAVVAIATQDLLSAVIVLLTIPLVPLFAALVGWRTRDRASRQWRQMSLLAGHFLDVVKGLPTLVSYRRARHQTSKIRTITHQYRRATISTLRLAFASSAVLELIATISVALVAVSVGLRLAEGSMDLRTALVVLLLAPEAYWPIRRVGAEFHAAAQGAAAFAEADKILSAETGVLGPYGPTPNLVRGVLVTLDGAEVTFPGQPEPALRATSGSLSGPGLVAVTGASGAGKSTLLAAIQGRLPLSTGDILVNGTPLGQVDPDWWTAQVSWSPQRPYFVHGSIADNLRLGRPGATDSELWDALRTVGLGSLVSGLPSGLDASVDEDGLSLSGGERARLALARVVVADRKLVLLDEPTAHLDPDSEAVVVATINTLAKSALVVVVTHRPAIERAADQVIRLVGPARPLARPAVTPTSADQPAEALPQTAEEAPAEKAPADVDWASPRRTHLLILGSILLGTLASASGVALMTTAGWLIVKASTHPPVLILMVAIVAVRLFGIARPVLRYLERLISHDAALRLLAEKRASVFAALVPLTPARLGRRRGDVLASVVDDVEAWVDRRLRVWMPLSILALTSGLVLAVTGALLPEAALIDLLLVSFAGLVTFCLVRISVQRSDSASIESRACLSEGVTELLEGSAELRAWGAADRTLAVVDRESRRLEGLLAASSRRATAGRAGILLMAGIAVSATLAVLAGEVANGGLSRAAAASLALVPLAMVDLLLPVPDAAVADVRTRSALARLDELLDQSPAVLEPEHPRSLSTVPAVLGACDVSAGWGAHPAFRSLDLVLPEHSRTALVGPSGSGKSTVAALLVRFIDPMQGNVRYGDTDLRACTLDDVRGTIGLLDDDPHIFSSTLAENVRFARPGASDRELETALRKASLGPWLDGLPGGLHTWLGQGNRSVSGGERARIGMARVILADHPVVVLDEPTAHLDHQTANEVMASLFAGASTRGILLITHRPEGMDLVDNVVSLTGRTGSLPGPEPEATRHDLAEELTANA